MRNFARVIAAAILAILSVVGIGSVASAAPTGSISGTLFQADGTTPLVHGRVNAYDYNTGTIVAYGYASNGIYTISGLPSGSYRVMARADGYFTEYYNNVPDYASATAVNVNDPNNTPSINFTLAQCGSISGTITSDNGTPIYSGHIMLFDSVTHDMVDETWMTATSNVYRIGHDLLSGSYLIRIEADGYFGEYYNNVTDIDLSTPVVVTSPNVTPGINFTLNDEALHISAVSATSTGSTTANITWTTDQPATSQVEYGLWLYYGSSTTQDSNLVTAHTVSLTGLTAETTYYYRVRSTDALNNETSAGYTLTTGDVTAPRISSVKATSIAATSAKITWTTNEKASSQVEYGLTTSYGSSTTLDSGLVTSHSVNLTDLGSFKTYHCRVKSSDAAGNPATSADFTFTTTDVTVPTSPVVSDDGKSTRDLAQLHASWTSSDEDSGVTEYQYAIGTTSGGTDVVNWTSAGTDTEVTKTGLSLSAGTTYYFSVKAKNGVGLWSTVTTSDGIVARDATSGGGGMPVWAWILIGLGVLAAVGALGYFAFMRSAKQQ